MAWRILAVYTVAVWPNTKLTIKSGSAVFQHQPNISFDNSGKNIIGCQMVVSGTEIIEAVTQLLLKETYFYKLSYIVTFAVYQVTTSEFWSRGFGSFFFKI